MSFSYPGAEEPALEHVTLHLTPGTSLALVGENGSGKTTLIKLLTRLYTPTSGRILLDGQDLADWDEGALRQRIGVIFQDFARYQMLVGENVGAGDERYFEDQQRWRAAAEKGRASEFIETLPAGYQTQLGKWFRDGRELSGGQWQKIALSRAFMRTRADILVLDEPTAAMDAQAEAEVFEHFRQLARDRITILISHRFSTVRMADQILVLSRGRIVERGTHEELMRLERPLRAAVLPAGARLPLDSPARRAGRRYCGLGGGLPPGCAVSSGGGLPPGCGLPPGGGAAPAAGSALRAARASAFIRPQSTGRISEIGQRQRSAITESKRVYTVPVVLVSPIW